MKQRILLLYIILFSFVLNTFAEGTKTMSPDANTITALLSAPDLSSGPYRGCNDDNRVKFWINDFSNEKLYFGFDLRTYTTGTATRISNAYYRIYNPDGSVAVTAKWNRTIGVAGSIDSYTQAVNGPNIGGVTTGYIPLVFTPTMLGEHWIEIYQSNDGGVTPVTTPDATSRIAAVLFDLTVAKNSGATKIDGRVYSNKWGLYATDPSYRNSVTASSQPSIYAYVDQSIVKIAFQSGFEPIAWNIAVNNYGASPIGSFDVTRISTNNNIAPELPSGYKVFLNVPDPVIFPVGSAPTPPSFTTPTISGCGPYLIHYNLPEPGDVKLFLNLNGVAGYQAGTADRILEAFNVSAGNNSLTWDGLDGTGATVPSGTSIKLTVINQRGRYNVPLYDVEMAKNGILASVVSPVPIANATLYWDDSKLTPVTGMASGNNNKTGAGLDNTFVGSTSPVHAWSGNGNLSQLIPAPSVGTNETDGDPETDFGNVRTINTWGWAATASSSELSLILGCADLSATKTVNNSTPNVGTNVTFTVTAKNLGPSLDANVVVNDLLPSGYTFVSATPSQGSYVSGTGVWTVGTLNCLASATLNIVATVKPTGSYANTATITGGQEDPTTSNNTVTNTPTPVPVTDLSVTKTAASSVIAGQNLTYTITVTNNGPSAVVTSDHFKVTDALPANFTPVTYTASSGTYTSGTGDWTGVTMASGQSVVLTIAGTVSPSATGTLNNVAVVTAPTGNVDPNTANNTSTPVTTTVVNRQVDLSINKSAVATVVAGQTMNYIITVTNNGPSSLISSDQFTVNDALPAGFTATSYTPASGTFNSSTDVWTGVTLASGQSVVLTIAGTVNASATGSLSNTASVVVPSNVTDPTPGNNTSSTVSTTINRQSDLSIIKTAASSGVAGENLSYTITVKNNGTSDILSTDQFTVTDALPGGFTVSTYTPSGGTYTPATGAWTGLTLASGASATLVIAGKINGTATGTLTNTASVTPPTGVTDPNGTNNTSSAATTTVTRKADLSITKTAPASVIAGGNLTYTITVTNNGPSSVIPGDIFTVNDVLPANYTATSFIPSSGSYTSGTGNWTGVTLESGQSIVLTINGVVSASATTSLSNTASVTPPSGLTDTDLTNNTSAPAVTALNKTTDLSITKNGPATAIAGQSLTYSITVTNNGPSTIQSIDQFTVTDALPGGFTANTYTASSGTYNSGSGAWTGVTMTAGQSVTLTIAGTVNSTTTGSLSNTASVAVPTGFNDPTPGNNTSTTVSTTVNRQADLSISKTAPANGVAGQSLSYTITVTNNGPSAILSTDQFTVTDALPGGFTATNYTVSSGTYTSASGAWTGVSIASGGSVVLTIAGTVNGGTTGSLSNTASVIAPVNVTDPAGANNTSTAVTTTVSRQADLSITKTAPSAVVAGGNLTYTITITNNGPSSILPSDHFTVTDVLPADFTATSYSASSGVYTSGTGEWSGVTMANGQSVTLTITGTVSPSATSNLSNTASVTAPAGVTDSNTANNTSAAAVTSINNTSDLAITKSAAANATAGQGLTYTITVTNYGPSTIQSTDQFTVTDVLPTGFTANSFTPSSGTYTSATGKWTGVTMTSGQSVTLVIAGTVNPDLTGSLTNVASVAVPTGFTDPTPGNNTSLTASTTINRQSDLSITKSASATAVAGGSLTYTLTVTNNGPSTILASDHFTVSDALPSGFTATTYTPGSGTYNSSTGDWTGVNIVSGASVALIITGTVNEGATGTITNSASVTAPSGVTDPTIANNTATTVSTTISRVTDLSITKTAPENTVAGQSLSYTITVKNNGPSAILPGDQFTVTDVLPANFSPVSYTASSGTYTSSTGAWSGVTLANGQSVTLTIAGTVNPSATGTLTNTASVTAPAGVTDPNTSNNTSATVSTSINNQADLSITKTSSAASVIAGQALNYTLTVTNNGPSSILSTDHFKVTDVLPSGYTANSYTASSGTYNSTTGDWTGVKLNSGQSVTLTIAGNVNGNISGSISNTASVEVPVGITDPTPANNTSTTVITTINRSADMSIVKSAPFMIAAGQTMSYLITVTNNGPSTLLSTDQFIVTDVLPGGFTANSYTASAGTYNQASGVWTGVNLNSGQSVTLTINGTVNPGLSGTLSNTATVAPNGVPDPDFSNNTSADVSTTTFKQTDLSISKTVDNASPAVGSNVTFTIAVKNNGPSNATGVSVNEVIPDGYTLQSISATKGTWSAPTWNIGSMTSGTTETMTIVAKVNSTGSYFNSVTVTGGETDPNLTNNSSTSAPEPKPLISINNSTATEGSNENFTITLSSASTSPIVFTPVLADVTATVGTDTGTPVQYSVNGGTSWSTWTSGDVTIPAGVTSALFRIPTVDDNIAELTETFTLNINVTSGNTTNASVTGTATILDNDPVPSASINDVSNTEGSPLTFTVTLTNPSSRTITLTYNTSDGTAKVADNDYTAISATTLTFAPGEVSKTVTVSTISDNKYETDETLYLNLSSPVNATISDNQGIGTILNDDAIPSVIINDASVVEGGNLNFVVNLSNPSESAISVTVGFTNVTTSDDDYETTPITVNFPAGTTTATVVVPTIEDLVDEDDETFIAKVISTTGTVGNTTDTAIGTIIDNDGPPSISINNASTTEGGDLIFTVTLSNPSATDITFTPNLTSGTAVVGTDTGTPVQFSVDGGSNWMTWSSGDITILSGETDVLLKVATVNDNIVESTETFNVNLTVTSSGTTNTSATGTGSIIDNDKAELCINDITIHENVGYATFTVILDGNIQEGFTVDYYTTDSTALAGSDYTATTGTITFPAGSVKGAAQYIPVEILNDNVAEPTEAFKVYLTHVVGLGTLCDSIGVGTILDDDAASVAINDVTVNESAGTATFTVTLTGNVQNSFTVDYHTSNNTATAGSDYTATTGTITFPAGSTNGATQTITVPILNDNILEPTEAFDVTLNNISGLTTISDATGVGTITDDDAASISVNDVTVNESAGTTTFNVVLAGNVQNSFTVDYQTSNNTALAGSDYIATSGTVTFSAGSTNGAVQTITVPIINDNVAEPTETFNLALSNITGLTTISDGNGVGTITDDDAASISINNISVNEPDGTATFTVTLTGSIQDGFTANYHTMDVTALAGSDYTSKTGTITFPAGSMNGATQTITIPIIDDAVSEPTETFNVVLDNLICTGNVIINTNTGICTIIDDDKVNLTLNGFTVTETETSQTANFTVTLNKPAQENIVISFSTSDGTATAGSDYTAQNNVSFTIPVGTVSLNILVEILGDLIAEPTETFQGTISIVTANGLDINLSTPVATATITDNDAVSLSINDVTVNESDGTATFTVNLTGNIQNQLTVDYATADNTALAGSDYTSTSGTLTFPAGSTSGTTKTITVPILEDLLVESTETFYVNLTNLLSSCTASIADGQGIGTIIDKDAITANDNVTTNEDTPVTINILGNDTYAPDDVVKVTSVSDPANGSVVINPDGTVTYTPDSDFNGTDTFTYTVTITNPDGSTTTETATVTVTVTPVKDAQDDNATTPEDIPVVIDVLSNDGFTGTNHAVTGVSDPANGSAVINPDGTVTYTPDPDFNGTDTFTYTVTVTNPDGSKTTETATVTVTVTPVSDIHDDSATTHEDISVVITVLANDGYTGSNHSVTNASDPANGSVVVNADGTVKYIPDHDFNGTDTFTYTVTTTNPDGTKTTETATVTVTVTPVKDVKDDAVSTPEETPVLIVALANDAYSGNNHAITAVSDPANGSVVINPDGTLTYTPDPDFNGTDTFTYTVTVTNSDGTKTTETATVTVTVTPVKDVKNDSATTPEDTPVVINVLANDGFTGTNHAVTGVSDPANGSVVINPDGTVTYTPEPDFNGTDTFTYTVTVTNPDGTTTTETATVTVTVTPVKDVQDDSATTPEDTPVVIDVLANDGFTGTNHTVTAVSDPVNGSVVINSDGTVTYTPDPDFNGTDTFTYTVTVTNPDGTKTTETATVTVTVTPVKDIQDDSATTPEDTPVVINVLANDGFTGTNHALTGVSDPANGSVVINPDGTVTYTPDPDFNGTDTFTYTVTITNPDGTTTTETAIVTVTVTPVKDVQDDSATTPEDTPIVINVLANDGFTGTNHTVTGVTDPANGSVVINPDGTVTYTPDPDFNGTDTFTYTVTITNPDGTTTTETATVTVTVTPVQDAQDDSATTPEDTPVVIDVLANDGFTGTNHTVTGVTDPANGSVVINPDGTVTYTPAPDFNGTDTFTYTVTITNPDGTTTTETATVTVTVTPVKDAQDDSATTPEDTPVVIDVLANDGFTGTTHSVTGVTDPANGSVVINPDGTVTYTPDPDFNGTDTFTYTVTEINPDGTTSTETATVTVTVTPVKDTQDDSATTPEDTPVVIDVLANDGFIGTNHTITEVSDPANGSVVINPDGTVTYTPDPDFNGTDTFTYTVTITNPDGTTTTETATVTVTVTPVKDVQDDNVTTPEDTQVIIPVLANDGFVGNNHSVTSVSDPANGSAVINPDGTVTYTPDPDFNGTDIFTYTVTITNPDGTTTTETATVTVIVTPVKDTKDDNATTPEDTPVVIDVLANDGFTGTNHTVTGVTDPANGSVVINPDGTVTYTPDPDFNGTDTFIYTVTVTNSDGTTTTETATVTVTVTPVKDTQDDSATTPEDTPVVIDVLANDGFTGTNHTVTAVTDPVNGSVVINLDGTVTYTPDPDFNGTDTFTYTVTSVNPDGTTTAETATVTVTVTPVQDAQDDNVTTPEDTPIVIDVLANDGFTGTNHTVTGVTDPANGSVVINPDGTVTYTPDPDFNGTDTFIYTVTVTNADGTTTTETATVTVIVTPVNDPPVADQILYITTNEDVTFNGQIIATDVDGDTLTYTLDTPPAHGTVIVQPDGTYVYTPDSNYVGDDVFSVTVDDGNGGTITITVNVTVTPVNDAPVAVDDIVVTLEDNTLTGDVLLNDSDVDSNNLTVENFTINGVTFAPGTNADITGIGTIEILSNGTYTFVPLPDYYGDVPTIVYTVSDGSLTTTANLMIKVLPLPEIYKSSGKPVMNNDGTFSWTYTIRLVNDTHQTINNIQVEDNLDDVFKSKGCTYEVTSVTATGILVGNALFNGSSNLNTLVGGDSLKIDAVDTIQIQVRVDTHGQIDTVVVYNQAILYGMINSTNFSVLSDDVDVIGTHDPTKTVIPQISLFIPDGFSPNDDGINDKFVIIHPDQMKLQIEIFNRWGNRVYINKEYKNDWDGKGTEMFLGQDLPNGTYYCVYKAINGTTGAVITSGVKYITLRK